MRVEFINKLGGIMFVDESRVDEYKEAGYKLASSTVDMPDSDDKSKPKRTTKKKN